MHAPPRLLVASDGSSRADEGRALTCRGQLGSMRLLPITAEGCDEQDTAAADQEERGAGGHRAAGGGLAEFPRNGSLTGTASSGAVTPGSDEEEGLVSGEAHA